MQGNGGSQSSVNSASRGGRNGGNRGAGRGRGGSSGRGRGMGGRGRSTNSTGQKQRFTGRCQVCFKEGHSAPIVGIALMLTSSPTRRMPTLLTCMVLIAIGILIPVQQIISPASSTG
jgi:hypothetical protein